MTDDRGEPVSFGRRITDLAEEHPLKTAIVFAPTKGPEQFVSWADLDLTSNRVARLLASRGVDEESTVVVGLPNSLEHIFAAIGAWKLGALVLPLPPTMPAVERDRVLELARPTVVVADWEDVAFDLLRPDDFARTQHLSEIPLPDVTAHPGKSIGSGGSTGLPKIIIDPAPWAFVPGRTWFFQLLGWRAGQAQFVAGPLYHNSPFSTSHHGLFEDHQLVLMERLDAARAVDLIEQHRVQTGFLAPTMMRRIAILPDVGQRDFTSVEGFYHTGSPCPTWLKREWIDLIGPEHLYEAFGSTEYTGVVSVRGDEWLEHPGTLGRPRDTDLKILDDDWNELPPNEVGEIYMRPHGASGPMYEYRGSPPLRTTPDGFASVGDMGWVDEEGYLFLADRRVDLIITGGENVYPAEVEGVLSERRDIADVAVVGLPDEEWGRRVHAIVQPDDPDNPPDVAALDAHCRERLMAYKAPKSYEFVARLPRDAAGKIRRSTLIEDRTAAGGNAAANTPIPDPDPPGRGGTA